VIHDRHDAEYPRQREMAKLLQDQNWRDALIGDSTYLRSLMILGYGDRDARTELSLLLMEKMNGRRSAWPVQSCERKIRE
jgi:hypothetical protein